MSAVKRKQHWEKVYSSKQPQQCSWFQSYPVTSMQFIEGFDLPRTAKIIDVGGGDSLLVDALLEDGYSDVTVLDISEHAIIRAQQRLGERAASVQWIVSDIMDFTPEYSYDIWHDRATFHFLVEQPEVESYIRLAQDAITPGGLMTIGTFSTTGPERCSGLQVHQYSEEGLKHTLQRSFNKIRCIEEQHETPFHTMQNFLFCSFRRN
jgi:2-polyprenyl-3-methyl-5-hydroxy-6-metoxy-1,4-benzoquinol methylase